MVKVQLGPKQGQLPPLTYNNLEINFELTKHHLATLSTDTAHAVAVKQVNVLATAFHPELTVQS